jgi:hypothetical protein
VDPDAVDNVELAQIQKSGGDPDRPAYQQHLLSALPLMQKRLRLFSTCRDRQTLIFTDFPENV